MRRRSCASVATACASDLREPCSRRIFCTSCTVLRWATTFMASDALVLSVAMAVAAGLVGFFAVMRRMALAGDALSHVALPGIGVALALHIHPVFGASAMLFFGALLVWALQERTRLATETTIGVVFSAALAIGSMMASGDDLIEALFGTPTALSRSEIAFGLTAALAVIVF